jgi:hypothetical protein
MREAPSGGLECDSLDALVERCRSAHRGRPIALCVGSGISLPYPSLLPSAAEVLRATAAAFAPKPVDAHDACRISAEVEAIGEGLPEACYEMLLDVAGGNVAEVWRAVDLWRDDARSGNRRGPNAAHYAAVLVASRSHAPIVTPNYDLLLEEAASRLGLGHTAGEPGDDAVAVWKIHGSVDRLDSIRTTLRTITVADWEMLRRIRAVFTRPGTTACLVGYSGRDLDFFPHLASWELDDAFWLDRSFAWREHAIHRRPDAYRAVEADVNDWALRVLDGFRATHPQLDALVGQAADAGVEEDRRRSAAAVREHAAAVARRVPDLDQPRRRLIHALALHAAGNDRAADRNLDVLLTDRDALTALTPRLRARALLLASDVHHEFSRFADSVTFARRAALAARGDDGRADAPTLVEARLHIEGGLILQSFGHLPNRRRQVLAPRAWLVIARCMWTCFYLPSRYGWLRRGLRGHLGNSPDEARAIGPSFGFLEHLVRTAGVLQGIVATYAPFAVTAFRGWWRYLQRRCEAAGYAYGVANSKKYLARIADDEHGHEPSGQDLFLMFAYPTGQALTLRDRGDRLLARAGHSAEPRRTELRRQAFASFATAREVAARAGNAAVELHSMIGMAMSDDGCRFEASEIEALLDQIQSPVYQRSCRALLALLARPEGPLRDGRRATRG